MQLRVILHSLKHPVLVLIRSLGRSPSIQRRQNENKTKIKGSEEKFITLTPRLQTMAVGPGAGIIHLSCSGSYIVRVMEASGQHAE